MAKPGPNELCPCGSGRKFKKCCGDPRAVDRYTREDRTAGFARLDHYIDAFAVEEEERAGEAFWGRFAGRADELPPERAELFDDIERLWFLFDCAAGAGGTVAERVLAGAELAAGERAFLSALVRSSMRIHEIVEVRPGASLALRDAIEGGTVTVNERQASRTLGAGDFLVARVVSRGPSGGPEIEAGLLHLAPAVRDPVIARIRDERARFLGQRRGSDLTAFYKTLPPLFHEVWISTMLESAAAADALGQPAPAGASEA